MGVRISLIAVLEGFQLLHLLRCKSIEVKYLSAYGLPVFALYWALLGLNSDEPSRTEILSHDVPKWT
jgi:hypothetical protein